MSEASFHQVISEHLALSERNRRLEGRMPLDGYREANAPRDEAVVDAGQEHWLEPDSSWDTTRERPLPEFNWGDQ
jgi:hypothetical protein